MNAPIRPLYVPSAEETLAACETLLRSGLPRETRKVIRDIYETMKEKDDAGQ